MKKIILLRHGHTVPALPSVDDVDRELTIEGEQEILQAAQRIQQYHFNPQHITTSPAIRAAKSAHIVAAELEYPEASIEIQPFLYLAPATDILVFIEAFSNDWNSILILGHNPGLSECARLLSKKPLDDLKTATGYLMQWGKHSSWKKIANGEEVLEAMEKI